jgi:hypothetical protein
MIKEKCPLHNLFVKVSEELDFVPAIKPLNSYPVGNQTIPCITLSLYFYAGTIADNEQALLYCAFAPFFRFPWIYGTLQFHFFKGCVFFIDFVPERDADRYIS